MDASRRRSARRHARAGDNKPMTLGAAEELEDFDVVQALEME